MKGKTRMTLKKKNLEKNILIGESQAVHIFASLQFEKMFGSPYIRVYVDEFQSVNIVPWLIE